MRNSFKFLNDWILKLSSSKWSTLILLLCTVADASFLPLPTSTLFLLLVGLNCRKFAEYIITATLGTMAGAILAYMVGHFSWFAPDGGNTVFVKFLFSYVPGFTQNTYLSIQTLYTKWDFWLLCIAATTPIPYGIFAIFSGVFEVNILVFTLATLLSQSLKFTLLAFFSLKLSPIIKKLLTNVKPVPLIVSYFNVIVIFISGLFKNLFQ